MSPFTKNISNSTMKIEMKNSPFEFNHVSLIMRGSHTHTKAPNQDIIIYIKQPIKSSYVMLLLSTVTTRN